MSDSIKAPLCNKIAHELIAHDDVRIDHYYWLKDRENAAVIAHLEAENAYREAIMLHTKPLQDTLYEEIVARIKQTDMSVPYKSNGYWYYTRYEEGKEYQIYCRKKDNLDSEELVILNVNELAEGKTYCTVAGLAMSDNNQILAFGEDNVSRRNYTLRFKNLVTGEMYPDSIADTEGGSYAWAADNEHFFYIKRHPETLLPYQVWRHHLGTESEQDVLVYEETDHTFYTHLSRSKSKQYIGIYSSSTLSSEYRFLKSDNPQGEWQIFCPREREHEYNVAHYGDKFYIISNWNAKNFRLMSTSVDNTAREHWEEVIAHRTDVLLEDLDIFNQHLVLSERSNGITQLRIRPWEQPESEHYVDFGESVYMAYTAVNPDFDTNVLRLGYTSLTTPNTVYDYDMEAKQLTLLKQEEVVGGTFATSNYVTERLYATAKDNTKIPISIVYNKNIVRDGQTPLLLYAYGSYGYSMDPYFSSTRLSLLDRGFMFAIAHVRGGQEMGRHWYEQGRQLEKINTFTDFIACSEHLIATGYTQSQQLYAMGGSAGGLLMGAIVNMRPDLYKGIIAAVPFVDVVTTMLDESIPLTTGEFDEWGNPKIATYYHYMKSYSPYDNVIAQHYPAMLVTTGLHDSQVQYWEPAKWVAKLRELKTNQEHLLLYINMTTGHGGASGRFERYHETAMEYAFLLDMAAKS